MVDVSNRKPRGPDKAPRKARMRASAKETPRPTVSYRMRADVYEKTRASALAHGFSLSEEMEARINASFDAETLEATLRRVVREEINQHLALTGETRIMSLDCGDAPPSMVALMHNSRDLVDGVGQTFVLDDDALAVMAEAQH